MAAKGKLMAMAHLPDDPALLAAVGAVTIRHSFLDWTLNRTIKTLIELTPDAADWILAREPSATLRRKIRHIAKTMFGKDSDAYKGLNELLKECEDVTDKRNDLVHCIWATYADGPVLIDLQAKDKRLPLPTAAEVEALAAQIYELTEKINAERTKGGGFIHAAVQEYKARTAKK